MTTVVIGAGCAGLTAAHDMHKAGMQVVVLEARDRTGGRPEMERRFAVFPAGFGAEDILGDLVPT